MVTCWEKADLLALVCGVWLSCCHFPIDILGQVWCLIVSIPDLFPLSYFYDLCVYFMTGAPEGSTENGSGGAGNQTCDPFSG